MIITTLDVQNRTYIQCYAGKHCQTVHFFFSKKNKSKAKLQVDTSGEWKEKAMGMFLFFRFMWTASERIRFSDAELYLSVTLLLLLLFFCFSTFNIKVHTTNGTYISMYNVVSSCLMEKEIYGQEVKKVSSWRNKKKRRRRKTPTFFC